MIAGGGIAALEATLALRALAGDRVQITLVAPDPELTFRAPAALEAFGRGEPSHYELAAIARDLEVSLQAGRLEAVAPRARTVRLAAGHRLEYDALILATGARASASIPGALTFRDHRDAPALRRTLSKLDSGALTRLAFAVPPGRVWSLPLYELALLSGRRAGRLASGAEVVLLSPERRPLEVFGANASRLVHEELSAAGVRFIGDAAAVGWHDGAVELQGATAITAGRVVTVPLLRVPRMA